MQAAVLSEGFVKTRYLVFKWRYNLGILEKTALSFIMAGVIGILAQIRIPLPWSPVPITGSTFGAVIAGALMGNLWGALSVFIYLALGVMGLPVFSGSSSGLSVLLGPTGGYLIGLFFAALFTGYFTDKSVKAREFFPMLGIMLFAHLVIIYVPGLLNLSLWLHSVKGSSAGFSEVLLMGAVPFIPGDIIKSVIAALIATGITPKQYYNK